MNLRVLYFIALLSFLSCATKDNGELERLQAQLATYQENEVEVQKIKEGMIQYLDDWSAENWEELLRKNMPNNDAFFERHKKFRETHQNLKYEILHYVGTIEQGMMWLEVSTIHGGSGGLHNDVLRGIEPSGKPIVWEEVWYYGDRKEKGGWKTWDIVSRDLDKMKSAGITCLPDDFFEEG